MDETQSIQPQQTPPRETVVESAPQRPTWVLVIGIIAIVIASLGIVTYGLCTPASTIVSGISASQFAASAETTPEIAPTAAQMQVTRDYAPLTISSACVTAALGVVLLVGGIGLVRMRPWARPVMVWWAALRLVVLVPATYISWLMTSDMFKAMEEAAQASGTAGPGASFFAIFSSPAWTVGSVVIGVLFVAILPVFTLWWFNRRSIRDTMATWPKPPATG